MIFILFLWSTELNSDVYRHRTYRAENEEITKCLYFGIYSWNYGLESSWSSSFGHWSSPQKHEEVDAEERNAQVTSEVGRLGTELSEPQDNWAQSRWDERAFLDVWEESCQCHPELEDAYTADIHTDRHLMKSLGTGSGK